MSFYTEEELAAQATRRADLITMYGKGNVWNTEEFQQAFKVFGFSAPCVFVVRKSDGVRGVLYFDHMPRFYYDFRPRQ